MITDWIMSVFINLLRGVFGILPPWTPDFGSFASMGYSIGNIASALNGYFPLAALAAALALVLGARLFFMAWTIVIWAYEKIPFKAT